VLISKSWDTAPPIQACST